MSRVKLVSETRKSFAFRAIADVLSDSTRLASILALGSLANNNNSFANIIVFLILTSLLENSIDGGLKFMLPQVGKTKSCYQLIFTSQAWKLCLLIVAIPCLYLMRFSSLGLLTIVIAGVSAYFSYGSSPLVWLSDSHPSIARLSIRSSLMRTFLSVLILVFTCIYQLSLDSYSALFLVSTFISSCYEWVFAGKLWHLSKPFKRVLLFWRFILEKRLIYPAIVVFLGAVSTRYVVTSSINFASQNEYGSFVSIVSAVSGIITVYMYYKRNAIATFGVDFSLPSSFAIGLIKSSRFTRVAVSLSVTAAIVATAFFLWQLIDIKLARAISLILLAILIQLSNIRRRTLRIAKSTSQSQHKSSLAIEVATLIVNLSFWGILFSCLMQTPNKLGIIYLSLIYLFFEVSQAVLNRIISPVFHARVLHSNC